MGNVNESEANRLTEVLQNQILEKGRPLSEDEIPRFRSKQLPTKAGFVFVCRGSKITYHRSQLYWKTS